MEAAGLAGLALSVVATVDLCLKYGKILVDTYTAYRDAEAQINERVVCVKSHWKRTCIQLDFLQRIWQSLDEEHQTIQSEILDILVGKLKVAIFKLDKLKRPRGVHSTEGQGSLTKKWKFVFVKECLDEVIQDLGRWQELFDPSWFLIMKVSSPIIDEELRRKRPSEHQSEASIRIHASSFRDAARREPLTTQSIFLPKDGLQSALTHNIPYSSAKHVQRVGSEKWLVVETIPCDGRGDSASVTRDIRNLAKKLSCGNPYAFGILQCRGVIRNEDGSGKGTLSFDFVFNAPKGISKKPDTLRTILASQTSHSLTERFALAKQLARSISYVHTLGFVHKNVRPETLLGFAIQDSSLRKYFLIGFDMVRMADGRTLRRGDSAWEKNLYRHPDRQGLEPGDTYTMQHDVYSLGVCLLEIGLWDSFVSYNHTDTTPVPGEALGLPLESREFGIPSLMKDHLVACARSKLPGRMGEIYADVVVNCLTCLEKDNPDFGDQSEFEDADGVLVGVRYIEKVLLKLDSITV